MIRALKAIYNLFGYGLYRKPYYVLKSKSYEFHNINIGLFSGNDSRMGVYIIEICRDTRMNKRLLATSSSAQFNSIFLYVKTFQSSYIYSG